MFLRAAEKVFPKTPLWLKSTTTLDSAPILDKLKERTAKSKKHILFVPDRFSLSYQKAVLEHLNIKGTFDIEVSSFPRLAARRICYNKFIMKKISIIIIAIMLISSLLFVFAGCGETLEY